MPLSFPSSPTIGQTSAQNGRTYVWSGYAWELTGNVAGHAASHGSSGADAITITAAQVSNFASQAALYGPVTSVNGLVGAVTVAGVADGNKGDITVSSSGASWVINAGAVVTADIADNAVTDAKIADMSASKLTGTVANARLTTRVRNATNVYLWSFFR